MEAGYLTELVNSIVPYVSDFATALSIFLYDVVLRLLGALWIVAKLTPWKVDDKAIEWLRGRIKSTREEEKTRPK